MNTQATGSQVAVEIADQVKCVVCGKLCFAMQTTYVCHNCWSTGKVGDFIARMFASKEKIRVEHLQAFRDEILGDLDWSDDEPQPEGEMTYAKNEIRRLQSLAKETIRLRQALIAKDQEIEALLNRILAVKEGDL